jgi:lipocalin
MKKVAWLAAVVGSACASVPLRVASTPTALRAEALEGTWRVRATNFPMWLDGARTAPTFTYGPPRRDDQTVQFDDTVGYLERGERGTIEGVDTQHPSVATHFTWRGRGLLALVSSEWDLVALDPAGQWAVIAFTPTLFTPAGVDVVARTALDEDTLGRVRALLDGDPVLAPMARGLTRLP